MKAYEVIKNKRIELGLTQKELGDMAGYTQQAIQKIENGSRGLNEHKIKIFSKILGLSIGELFENKEDIILDDEILFLENIIQAVEDFLYKKYKVMNPSDKGSLIFSLFKQVYGLDKFHKIEKLKHLIDLML